MADNNMENKPRGASRLAIIIAFVAAAFAAWIIIANNVG